MTIIQNLAKIKGGGVYVVNSIPLSLRSEEN